MDMSAISCWASITNYTVVTPSGVESTPSHYGGCHLTHVTSITGSFFLGGEKEPYMSTNLANHSNTSRQIKETSQSIGIFWTSMCNTRCPELSFPFSFGRNLHASLAMTAMRKPLGLLDTPCKRYIVYVFCSNQVQ